MKTLMTVAGEVVDALGTYESLKPSAGDCVALVDYSRAQEASLPRAGVAPVTPRLLLTNLEAVALAARAAGVSHVTQQSINYAVCQLHAEVEASRPAPGSNAELREEITMRFRKAREILAGIK